MHFEVSLGVVSEEEAADNLSRQSLWAFYGSSIMKFNRGGE